MLHMINETICSTKFMKLPLLRTAVFHLIIMLISWAALHSQTLEKIVANIGGRSITGALGQAALAPNGDRFAFTDRFANKIYILDFDGSLLWAVGENQALNRPLAVCFNHEDELLFANERSQSVMRVSEKDSHKIDTIANLGEIIGAKENISQIIKQNDSSFLLLGEKSGKIYLFDNNWKFLKTFIEHGQGKGKLVMPTQMAFAISGNMIVSDRKNYPVQIFDRDGKFLFYAGWGEPRLERGWEASAIGVDSRDIIYVADLTNNKFRMFDQSGHEIGTYPFDAGMTLPISIVMSVNNKMIVLDEKNGIFIYSFS